MKPRAKFWIEKDGELVLGDWRVSLLEAIEETGSLTRAAEKLRIPYRRAWGKIKEMETHLGIQIVHGQVGGVGGGHSELTQEAKDYLRRYKRFRSGLYELVERHFNDAFGPNSK